MANIRINDGAAGLTVSGSRVTDNGFGNAADFVPTPIATGVSRAVAHTLRLEMNFVNGEDNDVVTASVDGAAPVSLGSWEQYYRHDPEQLGGGNEVPTTDQLLFREAGAAEPANAGKGILFDDLRIESSGNPTGPQGPPGATGGQGPAGPGNSGSQNQTDTGSNSVLGVQEQSPSLRLAVRKKRLSRGRVAVRVRCKATAGTCKGKLRLTARIRGRTRRVGRRSFSVKAGKVKTVKVKLTRSARGRLGARGKLKVRVRSTGAKLGSQKLSAKTLVTLKD